MKAMCGILFNDFLAKQPFVPTHALKIYAHQSGQPACHGQRGEWLTVSKCLRQLTEPKAQITNIWLVFDDGTKTHVWSKTSGWIDKQAQLTAITVQQDLGCVDFIE